MGLEKRAETYFKKGYDARRNLTGRPKNTPVTNALRRIADETDAEGRSRADRLADKMFELAMNGSVKAAAFVTAQLEGKPKQNVEHTTGADGFQVDVFRHMTLDELEQ